MIDSGELRRAEPPDELNRPFKMRPQDVCHDTLRWLISFSLGLPCVMSIPLSKEKQTEVIQSLIRFFSEKLDIELSEVQARSLLTYIFHEIGPFSYNQGVEDAQKHLIRAADDLRGTCFQEPLTYWDAEGGSRVRRKP